jgi:nucleoid DNA-binding protein
MDKINKGYSPRLMADNTRRSDMKAVTSKGIKIKEAEFVKIQMEAGIMMREHIINGGDLYIQNVGTFNVRKRKANTKNTPIDMQYYCETGEKVPYNNMHSDDYVARIGWSKPRKRDGAYSFVPHAKLRKGVSAVMMQPGGHKTYPILKSLKHDL